MAYATASDMVNRFGEDEIAQRVDRAIPRVVTGPLLLAGIAGNFSGMTPDQEAAVQAALEKIERALTDASEVVKGYVGGRYPGALTQPDTEAKRILVRLACILARFELYEDGAPEFIEKAAKAATDTLRDISNGKLSLGETPEESSALTTGGVEMQHAGRTFDRDNSRDFI